MSITPSRENKESDRKRKGEMERDSGIVYSEERNCYINGTPKKERE